MTHSFDLKPSTQTEAALLKLHDLIDLINHGDNPSFLIIEVEPTNVACKCSNPSCTEKMDLVVSTFHKINQHTVIDSCRSVIQQIVREILK